MLNFLLVLSTVMSRWTLNAVTVAGGHADGVSSNRSCHHYGIYVDDHKNVIVVDQCNHCIMEWSCGRACHKVLVSKNGQEAQSDHLNQPTDVIVDEINDNLIICDWGNRRVLRRSRHGEAPSGETIIDNIACWTVAMDHERSLYIVDSERHAVMRYRLEETRGTLVVGGNGPGASLHQLHSPHYVCIAPDDAIYVSDYENHRVMKWKKDAKEGVIVAGGRGPGKDLNQLRHPQGVLIDETGSIYVADSGNNRVIRWCPNAAEGVVVAGDEQAGSEANQLHGPTALCFDRQFNLYVADSGNDRVQRFSIEKR